MELIDNISRLLGDNLKQTLKLDRAPEDWRNSAIQLQY